MEANARVDLNFEDMSLAHLIVRVAKIPKHEEFCDQAIRLLSARGANLCSKVKPFSIYVEVT